MNLKKAKAIHFTGIKGVGMTALALACQDLGKKLSGSDTAEIFPTDAILKKRQIKIKIGFNPQYVPKNCDLLIYTGAHGGSNNPEVISAKKRQIPVLAQAQALGQLAEGKQTVAVAGVGGKTTTAAMIASILTSAGFKPAFCIGAGNITNLGVPGRCPKQAKLFVAEADEYMTDPGVNFTPRFHYLNPQVAVLTNLEYDHPDVYPDLAAVYQSFQTFIQPAELTIINLDNPHNRAFLKTISQPVTTYGFSPQSDWQIIKVHAAEHKMFLQFKFKNLLWPEIILNVPGVYNAYNATAAAAAACHLGVSPEKINQGLRQFQGVKRRFEFIDQVKGVALYDDYAHHPTEIKAVLTASRGWLPEKRIIAVFQSHTYSRTKALLGEFCRSLALADRVIINDIFSSARETDNLGLTGFKFSQEIKKCQRQTEYCPGEDETINYLQQICRKNDVIFTLGAGNNWLWHKNIIKALKKR